MPTSARTAHVRPALLAAVLALATLGSCKNPCEKALDHMSGCLSDFCEGNSQSRVCEQLAAGETQAPECDGEAIAQAEAMLAQDCEELTGAFTSYIRGAQASEASLNVRNMATGARYYYENDYVSPAGEMLPPQFPGSVRRTPATVPCGRSAVANPSDWEGPTWQALNFQIDGEHYFAYEFESHGEGANATFTASAYGDLDCDGRLSTFRREGHVVGNAVETSELQTYDEGE